ncbi:MAG TPA: hypothetical protein VJK54_01625 [Chthoniobacterales bacterium]|nr:hypothetical protein [Chthoniobacterales bacterium]
MTLHRRFFPILLLISFLQPWRLAASTPGAEDFLKYVAEEGERLVDEVVGEEGAINYSREVYNNELKQKEEKESSK